MATALIIGIIWYNTYSKQLLKPVLYKIYDSLETFLLSTTIYNNCIWCKNWREMTLYFIFRCVICRRLQDDEGATLRSTEMGEKGCVYLLRRLCSMQKWSRFFIFFFLQLTAGPLKIWLSLRSHRTNALEKSINKSLLWREMFEIRIYKVFYLWHVDIYFIFIWCHCHKYGNTCLFLIFKHDVWSIFRFWY